MIYLTAYGYSNGNPSKAFRGVDANGIVCGSWDGTGAAVNFPYLYLTNPINSISSRICVDKCPSFSGGAVAQVSSNSAAADVTYDFTYNSSGSQISGVGSPAAGDVLGYDTYLVIDRICMPNAAMFTSLFSASTTSKVLTQGDLSNFITDTQNNWKYLIAALGWGIVISFVFMFMLRCLAGCIVWCSLFGIIIFFIGLGLIFLYNAGYLGAAASAASYLGVPSVNSGSNEVYGWICIGLGCFFTILVLCCCSRLRLAVAVCKSAGQFVASVCSTMLVPIIQTILSGGMWAAAIVVMVYLVSAATFTATSSDYFSSVSSYTDTALIRFYIFIFFTLWTSAFLGAMTIFIVASACSMWYYSHGPDSELTLPVSRSYKMVFRYHFGSLAFGALLLAIVQFLQMVVEAVKRQAENTGQSNKCFEYVIKCIECFLQCVECIVKFINTQAYIQIAIRGKNFCYAAKDGFELAWSNVLRYAIVGGVGSIIMFLGKLMIAALTAGGFYLLITYVSSIRQNYLQPFYQVIVIPFLFSWQASWATSSPCSSCPSTRWQWTPCWCASSLTRTTRRPRERRPQCMRLLIWPASWTLIDSFPY